MSGEAIAWIVIIIAALILIPVIGASIRKQDFKRQAQGKTKERKVNKDNPALYYDQKESEDYYKETLKNEARLRSRQNVFGPK